MTTAPFIWYKPDESTDLINMERDGDQTIVMEQIGGVTYDTHAVPMPFTTSQITYRKHRTKWGNYLLPSEWELRLLSKQWSGNWEYKDVYDVMVMNLSSQADKDGIKLIGHNVERIDSDPETMTSTYRAEAIGYVK